MFVTTKYLADFSAHIIMWTEHRIETADDVDELVCAELPPESVRYVSTLCVSSLCFQEPELRERVLSNMVHAPCSEHCSPKLPDGSISPCMRRYPFPFRNTTEYRPNGKRVSNCRRVFYVWNLTQVLYRRRENGDVETVYLRKKYIQVDNSVIVPYNRYMLWKYGGHINMEIITTRSAPKYLLRELFVHHLLKNFTNGRFQSISQRVSIVQCM